MGKHHKLFTDRVETNYSPEAIAQLFESMFKVAKLFIPEPERLAEFGDEVAKIMGADIQDRATPADPTN